MVDGLGSAALWAVVAALMALGLAGTIVPGLPGAVLVLAGAVLHAVATGFDPIGIGRLAILAALAVLAWAAGNPLLVAGARRGASRWALGGAIAGGLVGLFLGPLGVVLGPAVGAIAGELAHTKDLRRSVRSGVETLVTVLVGGVAALAVAVTMVALFAWWVWRG